VASYEKYLESVQDRNWSGASAVHFPNLVMSSIGGQVSSALGLRGIASTLVGGITAGLQALVHGFDLLRHNDDQDAVVVVAADEISPPLLPPLRSTRGPAPSQPTDRGVSLRPYDPAAGGMILGEGAVAVVLERDGHARGRGAAARARIAGSGSPPTRKGTRGSGAPWRGRWARRGSAPRNWT
jgi:3-oxoacyl-(acyl-carrier-protein) synthase